ncbi:hypothetical protein HG442_004455 [Candidatus Gracilibacteria bacterium]|nr:hypothetical protein [Candidatus Gracilibacteria bacterium]
MNAPIEDYPYDADFADASEYYNRLYDSVFNPDSITYTSSLSEKIEYLSIIVKGKTFDVFVTYFPCTKK